MHRHIPALTVNYCKKNLVLRLFIPMDEQFAINVAMWFLSYGVLIQNFP